MEDFHGSVTPSAKTTNRQRYSPSEVVSVKPSPSLFVDSQRHP
jgi:hypothetical protein